MTKIMPDKEWTMPKTGMTRKKPRGRPIKYQMPERIDATPEQIADVVMRMPNKSDWRYEQETGRNRRRPTT